MRTNDTVEIVTDLMLVVDGEPTLPVGTRLSYSASDPYAVAMTFTTGDGGVTWTFSRDLLFDGLTEPAGMGDVTLHPEDGELVLSLRAPGGAAEFRLDALDIADFLDRTNQVVQRGAESHHIDMDLQIERLLADVVAE